MKCFFHAVSVLGCTHSSGFFPRVVVTRSAVSNGNERTSHQSAPCSCLRATTFDAKRRPLCPSALYEDQQLPPWSIGLQIRRRSLPMSSPPHFANIFPAEHNGQLPIEDIQHQLTPLHPSLIAVGATPVCANVLVPYTRAIPVPSSHPILAPSRSPQTPFCPCINSVRVADDSLGMDATPGCICISQLPDCAVSSSGSPRSIRCSP